MFAHDNNLKRVLVSSLGAVLLSISCLFAAAGPVKAEVPVQTGFVSAP